MEFGYLVNLLGYVILACLIRRWDSLQFMVSLALELLFCGQLINFCLFLALTTLALLLIAYFFGVDGKCSLYVIALSLYDEDSLYHLRQQYCCKNLAWKVKYLHEYADQTIMKNAPINFTPSLVMGWLLWMIRINPFRDFSSPTSQCCYACF